MARDCKKGADENAVIVAVDEGGLLTTPHPKLTWAPIGKPPVVYYPGSRRKLTAIAGLSLFPSGQVREVFTLLDHDPKWQDFLNWLIELHEHYRRKIIIVWDRLPAHRQIARILRELECKWVEFEFLPGYAPDLNPVEYLWSQSKCHDLANRSALTLDELRDRAEASLSRLGRQKNHLRKLFDACGLKTHANLCGGQ